jgi:hypothetical protein
MPIKLRDIKIRVIKEKDGSYAIACSALGVYTVGETLSPRGEKGLRGCA